MPTTRAVLVAFVCVAPFASTPLAAQAAPRAAALCRAIAPVVQGELAPGAALPLPAAPELAAIAQSVAGGALPAGVALFAAKHAWPDDEEAEARLVVVPAAKAAGRAVVLVVTDDGQVRAGAVVDAEDHLDQAASALLAQFTGRNLPAKEALPPRTDLEHRLAALTAAANPLEFALVDLRRQMVVQAMPAAAILTALEQGEAPSKDDVAAARAAYAALQGNTARLAPMLGNASERYAKIVADAIAHLDAVGGAADAQARTALHKQLKATCRDCHTLRSDAMDLDLEEHAVNERARLGVGGNPMLVGYDVASRGLDAAVAQPLADACRTAFLLLGASRQ